MCLNKSHSFLSCHADHRNSFGLTARQLADRFHHRDIAELLRLEEQHSVPRAKGFTHPPPTPQLLDRPPTPNTETRYTLKFKQWNFFMQWTLDMNALLGKVKNAIFGCRWETELGFLQQTLHSYLRIKVKFSVDSKFMTLQMID